METKRCSGYKGVWACGDDYPDHKVPVSEFNKHSGMQGGLQDKCIPCQKAGRKHSNPRVNSFLKWQYLDRGMSSTKMRQHNKDHPEERAADYARWLELDGIEDMHQKPQGLGKIKRAVRSVLPFVSRGTGGSKSMTTHTQSDKKGEKVDEGWVYCIGFPEIPNRCKIGRTWPDGMPSIMRDARRFGRAVELAKRWSNDVDKSETAVHTILIEYNLRKLGYTDVGREVFECSVDDFHRAFAEHLCDQFEEEEGEDSISEG